MAKSKKLSELFQNKTSSDIPKSPFEKKAWIAARRIVSAQAGKQKRGADNQDLTSGQWGLVTTIYKNALKANKIPKAEDWTKAKPSKAVKAYKATKKKSIKAKRNASAKPSKKYSTR